MQQRAGLLFLAKTTGRLLLILEGFEYGTYVCLTDLEFLTDASQTICWASFDCLPKNLHGGLKTTLSNQLIRAKIDTILVLENDAKNTK